MKRAIATTLFALALNVTSFAGEPTEDEAVVLAQKAFERNRFNRDNFSMQEANFEKVVEQLSLERIMSVSTIDPEAADVLKKIREEFGEGPAWSVGFRRSKNVLKTGDWYDLQDSAIVFLVFETGRVVVLDRRFAQHPTDKHTQTPNADKKSIQTPDTP